MDNSVLVIGGGVAGMRAALDLAEMGHRVHLVERESRLGGRLRDLNILSPSMTSARNLLSSMVSEVREHPLVEVHLDSNIVSVDRTDSGFAAEIASRNGAGAVRVNAAGVILATGLEPVDVSIIPEFGYRRYKDVVTSLELEAMLAGGDGLHRPSDGGPVKTVVFVQCVGSRVEKRGVPYCSAVCCTEAIKNSIVLKERAPGTRVYILYIDIRVTGRSGEDLYRKARKLGVKFIRGQPSLVRTRGEHESVLVCGENTQQRELNENPADLVVLSAGLRMPAENADLLRSLGVRQAPDGLPSGKADALPVESGCSMVLMAGCVEGPKDVRDSVTQGSAAASRMAALLRKA